MFTLIDFKNSGHRSIASKLLCIVLALLMFCASAEPVMADVPMHHMYYMYADIYVDGRLINNYQLDHPVAAMNGSTYIPLDYFFQALLGLRVQSGNGRMEFALTEPIHYQAPSDLKFVKNHFADVEGYNIYSETEFYLRKALSTPEETAARLKKEDDDKQASVSIDSIYYSLTGLHAQERILNLLTADDADPAEIQLDLDPADFFICNGAYYAKLTALTSCSELPFSVYYDDIGGLSISTSREKTAEQQFSQNNRSYIEGHVAYLKHIQKKLTEAEARRMEYIFRHEATVNNISEELLMGLCRVESTYDINVSGGKAIGLMQLMPKTVTGSGWELSWVQNMHGNIEFGSQYIASKLRRYKGNETLALTAYNQGSGTVASGEYSTGYAEKVLLYKGNITAWCRKNGYQTKYVRISENAIE